MPESGLSLLHPIVYLPFTIARPRRLAPADARYDVTSRRYGRKDNFLSDVDRLARLEIFTE
jgi:hypothetical protein